MPLALGLAAVLLVAAEVFVLVQVVHLVGVAPAVALLIIVPVLGIRLVGRQGWTVIRRVQSQVAERQVPGPALLDGLFLMLAGALLIVPGFITDALGLLLLLPPVRAAAKAVLRWALLRRISMKAIDFRH
jgi:UPF0716 protein FxsA